jgi:hypothetical protein
MLVVEAVVFITYLVLLLVLEAQVVAVMVAVREELEALEQLILAVAVEAVRFSTLVRKVVVLAAQV